jgi:hexosaminidase
LTVTAEGVNLSAPQPAGLFWGAQTLRQLLPPTVEAPSSQSDPWEIPEVQIRDYPRFGWRGVMLDVSRHFFGPEDVKHFIDLMVYYKLNVLHLGLTNDQGWRLEIKSWPNLAIHGGSTQVGGGPGGYYTQETYQEIVAYAQSCHITIVPEIDLPGHTNAALASYPELNCDGVAPDLFTGTDVGFSSLCIKKEITYTFLDDVIREVAALTPGSFIHTGGDEAHATSEEDYLKFMERLQPILTKYGKHLVGWDEIAKSDLRPGSVVQFWRPDQKQLDLKPGVKVIVSLASKVYLDMKYNDETPLGLDWAGNVTIKDAYNWDPATLLEDLSEDNILGVEAALWTETIETMDEIEFMVFPRLVGVGEIGWSPVGDRDWDEYRLRLANHSPRLDALGVNFYRSPLVPWP